MYFNNVVNTILELDKISSGIRGVPPMLEATLREILSIVQEPVIAGGFAFAHYTRPRMTVDIDVIGIGKLPVFSKALTAKGYVHETNHLGNGITLESFTRNKNQPNEEGVDFMRFDNEAFEKTILSRAIPSDMLGFKVKIVSIEDLIIMKSLSERTKDKADLEALQIKFYDKKYVADWLLALKPKH